MKNNTIIIGGGRGIVFAWAMADNSFKEFDCNVAALVDTNTAEHPRIKKDLTGLGWTDVEIFTTWEEAIEAYPETNSAIVVTPDQTHADYAEKILASGRHMLLEKPVAACWEDCRWIMAAAEKYDKQIIQLGFVLRYSGFYRKLRHIVETGVLGDIVMIRANERLSFEHSSAYRRGWRRYIENTGGLINEKCAHDLDILNWLKKGQAEPVDVYSVGGKELFPARLDTPKYCRDCQDGKCVFRLENLDDRLRHNPDIDVFKSCIFNTDSEVMTNQSVTIRYSDNTQAVFTIMLYAGRDEQRDITIHGTLGTATGDLKHGIIELKRYRENTHEVFEFTGGMHAGGDMEVAADFFRCIKENRQPESTLADGVLASKIAFAANLSAQTHQVVKLAGFNVN